MLFLCRHDRIQSLRLLVRTYRRCIFPFIGEYNCIFTRLETCLTSNFDLLISDTWHAHNYERVILVTWLHLVGYDTLITEKKKSAEMKGADICQYLHHSHKLFLLLSLFSDVAANYMSTSLFGPQCTFCQCWYSWVSLSTHDVLSCCWLKLLQKSLTCKCLRVCVFQLIRRIKRTCSLLIKNRESLHI